MPKYRVAVTRQTTETAFVDVEAEGSADANAKALDHATAASALNYERDEPAVSYPYVTNCELLVDTRWR